MLKQTPPEPILSCLAGEGIDSSDFLLCTATDIDRLGRYQTLWLVATADRLLVVKDGDQAQVELSLNIGEVSEFRSQSVVGSGLLQARVNDVLIDILRYTNRHATAFQKVARKLDRYVHGEPIIIGPDEGRDPRRCPKCNLMLQSEGDVCPRCVDKGAVLVRIWRIFKPFRAAAALMMGLLLLGIGLDLIGPLLTGYLVDKVLPGSPEAALKFQSDPALTRRHLELLLRVVAILALTQLLRVFVNVFNGRLASRVGTAMTFDVRGRLVQHLEKLSVGYYDKQQVGSLVARVAYDTEALHGFVQQLTGGFLFQLLMVVGVGAMMFSLNVNLAFYTLIPAPFVLIGSVFFWRKIYPRYYRFWDASSKQAGMLSGTLSGIRVVKAFGQEKRESDRLSGASDYLRWARRRVDYSTALFNPTMALVFQLGGWIVWYVGGRDVLADEMTLGTLMAFFGYLWMFYGPLGTLTQFTNWLTQFVTQANRIFEILDTPADIADAETPEPIEQIQGHIHFDAATFGYDRNSPVLRDVSLEIQPGEMIGIVGPSGSGKTTLVNLLCRFYDVNEGRVCIDGVDIRKIRREDLREQVGVVLQDPFLFRGSIWENITYGRPQADVEAVIGATKGANAHDFIVSRPHGYDTWVGERGAGLSGGERQRVSIARVLLMNPRILILDEATSSVDAESEAAIRAALAELTRDRTTIAIAHRLSTLQSAHRIVVIEGGKIAEEGTHRRLIEADGIYARLLRIQGQMATTTDLALATAWMAPVASDWQTDGPLPDPRGHHPRWLTPDNAHIHLGNLKTLHVTVPKENIYCGVFALRCLPVHFPDRYISLRYLDHEKREVEVGLIRSLKEWPEEAQRLVRETLLKRYFIHTILKIEDIRLFHGLLEFKVLTDLGPMEFLLRWQSDRAQDYGHNGKILLDTEENRYLIPDLDQLTDRERTIFQRFIYW
jgi:ATP-binding cassette subfamily B protein